MPDMNPAPADPAELAPPPEPSLLTALPWAIGAHVALLLVFALLSMSWRRSEEQSEAIEAEIWAASVQQAAPRAVRTAPQPRPQPAPEPRPKPQPAPEPKPRPPAPQPDAREADIAREQKEKEQQRQRQLEQQRQEKLRLEKERAEKERQDKLREEKERQEKEKQQKERAEKEKERQKEKERLEKQLQQEKEKLDRERRAEERRQAEADKKAETARRAEALRRMNALAGSGSDGADTGRSGTGRASGGSGNGQADRDAGPSGSFAGRVKARVKPNIVFPDDINGNPVAEVEVRTTPDGTLISARLVKASGNPAWDRAVVRAVEKTGSMPRDVDGRVHTQFTIVFRPYD